MRRYVFALALFGAAALAAGSLSADEPKKPEKIAKKDLAKLMADIHRGDKSAYSRVKAELQKDAPDWALVLKQAKSFEEMSAAFKKADLAYTSPAKYISSTDSLTKAAGEKDKKAAETAFAGLTQSCNSCHYGGARAMLKEPK